MLRQSVHEISVATRGRGFYEVTDEISSLVRRSEIQTGLLTLHLRHTSASLLIQENADPDVTLDLADFFEQLVPEDEEWYRHTLEGPDDMTSHIRSALTQTSLSIPIIDSRMVLGTWQGLYIFEHRALPMRRSIVAQILS